MLINCATSSQWPPGPKDGRFDGGGGVWLSLALSRGLDGCSGLTGGERLRRSESAVLIQLVTC